MRVPMRSIVFAAFAGWLAVSAQEPANDHNARGVELYEAKQWPESIAEFEAAMKTAPENKTIRRNMANALQSYANELAKERNMPAAMDLLNDAANIDPGNVQPFIQLGAYYLQEGLVADAIFRLEEAIEIEPKNIDAHFLLGEAYYKDNDPQSALVHWEWVKKAEPAREGVDDRIEKASREASVESNFSERGSEHFNIAFDKVSASQDVRLVLQTLENAYRNSGRDLGGVYPPTPIQISLYSSEGFSQVTQMGEHVGGLYDGNKIRVPVVDGDGNRVSAEDLQRRLQHEYVHVIVRYSAKDNAPWWFNEGLAEVMSRELTPDDIAYLKTAHKEGLLFTLPELSEGQLDKLEPDSLRLAYAQSLATMTVLKSKGGIRGLASMLARLSAGEVPEEALRGAFRLKYSTLELEVKNYIARQ